MKGTVEGLLGQLAGEGADERQVGYNVVVEGGKCLTVAWDAVAGV